MSTLAWTTEAWEDYLYWQKQDRKNLKRINTLIRDAMRTPYEGLGKPEPLRFDLTGYWSRRIDREHRLVYKFESDTDTLVIVQCRYHY
jgi:toxin YoeB